MDKPGKLLNASPERQRKYELGFYIRQMRVDWALRWCEPDAGGCGCMGCANNSGQLAALGYTKEEWLQWWNENSPKVLGQS